MLWVFIGITLGAIVFVIQIWMKHLSEARGIEAQIRDLEEEKHSLMQEWKSQQAGTQEANARFEEVRGAIAILNATAADLQAQIGRKTSTKERRGKYRVGPTL